MISLGGKAKTAKDIVPIIESYLGWGQIYVEPFVGGANVIQHVKSDKRYGCDVDHE